MSVQVQYDFIIAGTGCAGLSLAMHMIDSGAFRDKRILLVDQDVKRSNDRTWCFWEQQEGLFEPVVWRSWKNILFHGEGRSIERDLGAYRYKMIRGIDFYLYCMGKIQEQPNFEFRNERVDHIFSSDWSTGIICGTETIHARYVFNSIIFEKPSLGEKQYWMLQHFRGWTIETGTDHFDPGKATLMDFRTEQDVGTCFVYVLPFTSKKALVEYTVFSESLLPEPVYDSRLTQYISNILGITTYAITEKEKGVIPMTNFHFARHQNNVVNIGTAGGQTKSSSGYTFNFIQKNSEALVQRMIRKGDPFLPGQHRRFSIYDSLLLHVLVHRMVKGEKIFSLLFEKNPVDRVLRFLDNESTPAEECRIFTRLPVLTFMRAAAEQIF